jgi:site-specific recombinase XerD
LPAATTQRLDADLLSGDEVEALMRACSRRAPTGRRNRAMIAVMWRCGLRCSELLALMPKDVDPEAGRVIVQRGKGGKRRVLGLDLGTSLVIEQWLVSRRKLGLGSKSPLFCTLQGGAIDPSYLRHALPRIARRAGIEKRVHPHGLRHAVAVDLVRSGAPSYAVRDALGHESLQTTQVYLSRVGGHEVVEIMRGREWTPA